MRAPWEACWSKATGKRRRNLATLSRDGKDNYYEQLSNHYRQIRRFLPKLLKEIRFEGNRAASPSWRRWSF
jgi:hypothetical protein